MQAQFAPNTIEDGTNILTWRNSLTEYYSDLPGVWNLHDFLFVKAQNGEVVMKVRDFYLGGAWKVSPLHPKNTALSGIPTNNYKDKRWHPISDDKMANTISMYNRYMYMYIS